MEDNVRVLLVAPRKPSADLPNFNAEIQGILTSGLNIIPLIDEVRHKDVVRVFSSFSEPANPFPEIVIFMGHGNKDGILLDDGLLPRNLLSALVRRSKLVILNTCSSISIAQSLQEGSTSPAVITTTIDVPDAQAFQLSVSFFRCLAGYLKLPEEDRPIDVIGTAYDESRPSGDGHAFIYLPSRHRGLESGIHVLPHSGNMEEIRYLTTTVTKLIVDVAVINTEIASLKSEAVRDRLDSKFAPAIIAIMLLILLIIIVIAVIVVFKF